MLIGLAVACATVSEVTGVRGRGFRRHRRHALLHCGLRAGHDRRVCGTGLSGADDKSPDNKPINGVDELAGLGRTHPWAALSMAIFMFSLAGIPPLAGFWGKLNLFAGALSVRPVDWRYRRAADLVHRAGGDRRVECRHLGRLLLADRRRDVLSSGRGRAAARRKIREPAWPCLVVPCWCCLWAWSPIRSSSANEASQSARLPSIEPAADVASNFSSPTGRSRRRWQCAIPASPTCPVPKRPLRSLVNLLSPLRRRCTAPFDRCTILTVVPPACCAISTCRPAAALPLAAGRSTCPG